MNLARRSSRATWWITSGRRYFSAWGICLTTSSSQRLDHNLPAWMEFGVELMACQQCGAEQRRCVGFVHQDGEIASIPNDRRNDVHTASPHAASRSERRG